MVKAPKKFYILFTCIIIVITSLIKFKTSNFKKLTLHQVMGSASIKKKDASYGCRCIEKIYNFLNVRSCLIKSITKRDFLNSFGIKTKLYIGVSYDNNFKSHSWISAEEINCFEKPDAKMKIIKILST